MSPPKRALFSLNLDSDAEHVHQRIEDHSKEGTDRVKVIETKGPTHSHTNLEFVSKPFENLVNRTVDGVIEGTGKKVHSAEGDLHYSNTETSSSSSDRNISVKNNSKRRAIEKKYDTSEL